MKKTMAYLHERKTNGHKIVMLTCYDYPTAVLQEKADVDVIFVGDSVGTNVLGYQSETQVSLDEMIYHLRMVRRGVSDAYLLVDMPYKTYEDPASALNTAQKLLSYGADGVKLEGFHPDVIKRLSDNRIEVCGHLGYNPQYHTKAAVQGKTQESASILIEEALQLQQAGASMLVLELMPDELAAIITNKLRIPTIGIGAGNRTDGQVLIVADMLGSNPQKLRHAKRYTEFGEQALSAFQAYADEVRRGAFPDESNVRHMKEEERAKLEIWLHV